MVYVQRDAAGRLLRVEHEPFEGMTENLAVESEELHTWLAAKEEVKARLKAVDVAKLQKLVKDQGFLIDGGYGKIKGTTFRISNMGDETEASMQPLIAALDNAMKQL